MEYVHVPIMEYEANIGHARYIGINARYAPRVCYAYVFINDIIIATHRVA